ncbi:MAG: hypothetical protein AAF430_13165 [Myxococcota bacterium]
MSAPAMTPRPRSRAETGLALFCFGTVGFLVLRDLTLPEVRDTEVWFGFELRGWAAWLTAPLHWGLFAFGGWAFWRARTWIWTWAPLYAFGIAVSHLVWNLTSRNGGGWSDGVAQLILFSLPAAALLRLRPDETVRS